MRPEKAGAHAYRSPLLDQSGSAQHAKLGVTVQTVTGLDLERGDALSQQGIDAAQRAGEQLVGAGRTRRGHRRNDTAADTFHLLVGGAFQAHLEFAGAIAAVHDMGVAIDQRRCDQAPVERASLVRGIAVGQRSLLADPVDEAPSMTIAPRSTRP